MMVNLVIGILDISAAFCLVVGIVNILVGVSL